MAEANCILKEMLYEVFYVKVWFLGNMEGGIKSWPSGRFGDCLYIKDFRILKLHDFSKQCGPCHS